MKKKSMKSYVSDLLSNYLKKHYELSLRYKFLLLKSKDDIRLAELSQVYFLLRNDERFHDFEKYTNDVFATLDDFLSSNHKYVLQYNSYFINKDKVKNFYRKELLEYINTLDISMYAISKIANTNQSNVSRFFNGKENNVLSKDKLMVLMVELRSQSELANKKDSIL